MKFVKAKKLWENGVFVGDCDANYAFINCNDLKADGTKKAWLTREQGCCGNNGVSYNLTFLDPTSTDALVGVWVVQDGSGVFVDVADLADIITECEKCCDGDTAVPAGTYTDEDGVSTFSAITGGTTHSYCVTRSDDGSLMAQRKFQQDYYGNILTSVLYSANGTTSKYTVTSKVKPAPVLTDTVGAADVACS